MNLKTIIDRAQSFLHDDGTLWTRAELLRWANDGYREMLVTTKAVVRPYQIDVPGRTAWSISHDWEDRHARGTLRRFTVSARNGTRFCTHRWEAEMLEDIEPTNSNDCITQLWERVYSGVVDSHFRFALSKQHDHPRRVYWDDKRLTPISTREMDLTDTSWWQEGGEPFYVLEGIGREHSIEVFEIKTDYVQNWDLQYIDAGMPRDFSSDASRTYGIESETYLWDYAYTGPADSGMVSGLGFRITKTQDIANGVYVLQTWEKEFLDGDTPSTTGVSVSNSPEDLDWVFLGVGLVRGVSSSDRQYLACAYDSGQDLLGIARDFKGSTDAITVWEVITSTRSLTEDDVPSLIPSQLHKYLKFYVLAEALGRPGEGHRPDLAQHFAALYRLGAGQLAMLGNPSVLDRVYAREQVQDASIVAPPRVRLPSTFERVW